MPTHIFDGLSLVDLTGGLILAAIAASLVLSLVTTALVRAQYARLESDLDENAALHRRFTYPVLNLIVDRAQEAARRSREPNLQAIVEEHFQVELKSLLLGERLVRAATGLVIILGLMGTFYGLTLSVGRLVHLVAGDAGGVGDVTQAVTTGLTQALAGMAVAFSNSLLGIVSAVILTIVGVFSNLTDRRVAVMIRIETYLDRRLSDPASALSDRGTAERGGVRDAEVTDRLERTVVGFGESVERLELVVDRFDSALVTFATSTRDFTEFNAHLKDNVQRMSLSFGDLSETLRTHVVLLKHGNGQ